jgi:hypothetical protein
VIRHYKSYGHSPFFTQDAGNGEGADARRHAVCLPIWKRGSQHMVNHRDLAQGLVEYGLIIALVAVLAIAGLVIFGPAVSSLLSNLGGSV